MVYNICKVFSERSFSGRARLLGRVRSGLPYKEVSIMAKVTFSSLENKMSFESAAAVSARVMAEAAAASSDSEKLAIMQAGFEAMAAAEKSKDEIFSLVLRCNLLSVTDGDIQNFWLFCNRFYSVKAARVVFTDFIKKVANETKRIKKDTSGNWVADLTANDDETTTTTENKTDEAEETTTAAASNDDKSGETVNQ